MIQQILGSVRTGRRETPGARVGVGQSSVHILYFTDGGSIHDSRFLNKLVDKGYRVSYVYLREEGRDFAPAGVDHYHLSLDGALGKNLVSKVWARWRVYREFRRLVRKLQPDVLHAGWVPSAGFMAALSGYRPLLQMPWGSDILLFPRVNFVYRLAVRFALRRGDLITCDAEYVKREIVRLTNIQPEKVVVFPWGIDLDLFQPDRESCSKIRTELGWPDNPILIMTRRLSPDYGVSDFIAAMEIVVAHVPEVKVLLAGDGSLRDSLEEQVVKLGLSAHIRFLGAVPNADLPLYLNAADIYVSSSHTDGSSLSLLEAMACGLPVVVTDVPAILEWIEDGENGGVVPIGDSELIAEAIIRLIRDPERSRIMGQENLAIAKKRADWDRNFEVLESLYKSVSGT